MEFHTLINSGRLATFSQLDAAERQIERAIRLVLEEQDFICAITLACAAEGVLGEYLKKAKGEPLVDQMKPLVQQWVAPELSLKEINDRHLNGLRNFLKHAGEDIHAPVQVLIDFEAIQAMMRAIGNFALVTNRLPSRGQEFLVWLKANQPDAVALADGLSL